MKANIKTQFIKFRGEWSAFTTWRGMDLQEYGVDEVTAISKLLKRLK